MGTKEQSSAMDVSVSASTSTSNSTVTNNYINNANTTAATTIAVVVPTALPPHQEEQRLQQQQQPQQQQHAHLPKASPSPQVIIIPATQASTVATNAAKKIRRAFSMPRNPFRWSRKFKTTAAEDNASSAGGSNSAISSCVGGGRGRAGSIVSLSSYEAICKDTNGNVKQRHGQQQQQQQHQEHESNNETGTNADAKMNDRNGKHDNNNVGGGKSNGNGGNGSGCNTENGGTNSSNNHRVLRRSSFRKFLNRIAQHVSTTINVGANKQSSSSLMISTADRVPPIGSYQWPADQTPGVMGLKNHGNTCFMNAVLQCLSHTDILAEYFVLDQYKADLKRRNKINSRKFGTKGELTEQLANVLKALWTCKNESDHSTSFKAVVDRYGTQFRSSTQQDAQEFLFWLLDKVHEDLNTATKRRYKSVKNTYGRPDEVLAAETLANHIRCNNSFVQAVFQAQFRSSLTCPRCRKQSNTFDPFHCISVQLPQLTQQTIFVTVVYLKQHPRQVKLGLTVPAGSPIVALREQLHADTGIASDRMVLVDINKEGFTRAFYDTQPVATLSGIETIYCIEVPEVKSQLVASAAVVGTTTSVNVTTTTTTKTSSTAASTSSMNQQEQLATASSAKGLTNISAPATSELLLLVANVRKKRKETVAEQAVNVIEVVAQPDNAEEVLLVERFGTPFSMKAPRDCSYTELQKRLLREMSPLLKPEVFSYATPLTGMFQIRLQDPSADPDTYLEKCEHPLLTEMIDLALSVLSAEAGPPHIKLLLEWPEPEQHFADLTDTVIEHESVARLLTNKPNDTASLTLEQCLEHYTKAETLSAEDAWRCPHCQQYLPVVKTLGLWSLPDILVVHFKRFRQHHEKGSNAAKLTTMVKFPLMAFDMSPHLARGFTDADNARASFSEQVMCAAASASQHYRPSPWKKTRTNDSRSSTLNSRDNRETRYDLYAVCYHQGDTLETGHYTAACKNPYDRQWYKFDDQRVSKVPNENIQEEIINNEAYMLFYQRRSGDAAECSGSSSNSGDHWVSRIAPPPAAPVAATSTQQSIAQKLIIPNVKTEVAVEANVNAIIVEHAPEKIDTKPVEIPKVRDSVNNGEIKEDASANVAPNDKLAQVVVTVGKTNENVLVDIEELDFADAGVGADDGDGDEEADAQRDVNDERDADDDGLHALEKFEANGEVSINDSEDANNIFIMDEDSPLISNAADPSESILMIKHDTPTTSLKLSPLLKIATTARTSDTTTTKTPTVLTTTTTNGYKCEKPISPNTTATTATSNDSIATSSSSSSSLSSRSSPHSLAVSIHGASTLQNKFNGFSSTVNGNNYKETQLSSSLKSNSSSIIGASGGGASAVIAAHSHDTFHHVSHHQHNQWNGSRSSVSAVENASSTHQMQHTHTHCLNLRHSFSTSSNYKLRECSETLSSMLRNSANTCSKDTLIFIDQQQHHHHHHSLMEDEDDTFMGSRSLWISPVTPHKLITVSPKN